MSELISPKKKGWGMEWWYNAHFSLGVVQNVFIPILIPTYVLETTGSAGPAGVMLAIIGLGGLTAPIIGGLADKYCAHRWAQLLALFCYVIGGLLFAFSDGQILLQYAASACFGIGSATLMMVNPTFIVAAGFSRNDEAQRLTRMNQTLVAGQFVAGLGLAALTSAGFSYRARFLVLTGVALLSLVLTAMTNKEPAACIRGEAPADNNSGADRNSLKKVIFSAFGIFLVGVAFAAIAASALTGQFPNYMQQVFSIDPSLSSITLAVSSLVTLFVLGAVGRWMAFAGPAPIWLSAAVIFVISGALLIVLSTFFAKVWIYLPLALYVLFLQALSWQDLVQPSLAARASTAGAATTQGLLLFVIASSFAVASVVAAYGADIFSFGILAWIVVVAAVAAFIVGRIAIKKMS